MVLVTLAVGCAQGSGSAGSFGGGPGGNGDGAETGLDADQDDGTSGEDTDADPAADSSDSDGAATLDCFADPDNPACDCEARDANGAFVLGPCEAHCMTETWRYGLWVSVYNVAGTLGYGEHQGLGAIGYRYAYDTRFESADGMAAPWRLADGSAWSVGAAVAAAEQFRMRTSAPGGESYADAVIVEGDEDDLWAGESNPQVPTSQAHAVLDHAALCEMPELVLDERYFNHGRSLAETVPNHEWDSFFTRRDLIPLHQLQAIEITVHPDGAIQGPGSPEAVAQCLDVIEDGFCEARCGNCSYVLSAGFTGTPFSGFTPGHQAAGFPAGSAGPFQVGGNGQLVGARTNYATVEDGRDVVYVGGSSWGRPSEVSEYGPADWPDPDGVAVDPNAWMSVAGSDDQGPDGIPDEWTDPFTHCVDPNAVFGSQSPAGFPRFISGRWGHNSNSDAEALYRQFEGCATDPATAVDSGWWNDSVCSACGTPRLSPDGTPVQAPCQDTTHTATSYWERAPGLHNIEDFDPGRYSAVDAARVPVTAMSQVPDPICQWSADPVFGM